MKRMKRLAAMLLCVCLLLPLCACGSGASAGDSWEISAALTYDHSMERAYAEGFSVDYYQDGYALLTIQHEETRFLVVPEGRQAPDDLAADVVPLQQPLTDGYLAASAVMDMFLSLDALEALSFTSIKEEGWYLEGAREAMAQGTLVYAGKYSAPDYEQLHAAKCSLAIENTMIYHTPEVKEQLERLGIPVLVDRSSYEQDPLGRMEWIKVYGLLTGKEAEAQAAFAAQSAALDAVITPEQTGKTVAFFYITSNGEANVRRSTDYIPRMIEMAGGAYIFTDLGAEEDNASSTVTMQMEEFYAAAKDADYLVYNSTIDGVLPSVEALVAKEPLLANFKAVQAGQVFCTAENLYQSSMELGTFILDLNKMLTGDTAEMVFLYQLE